MKFEKRGYHREVTGVAEVFDVFDSGRDGRVRREREDEGSDGRRVRRKEGGKVREVFWGDNDGDG